MAGASCDADAMAANLCDEYARVNVKLPRFCNVSCEPARGSLGYEREMSNYVPGRALRGALASGGR